MANSGEVKNLSEMINPADLQAEGAPPPLPHFDQEATLLTARPVVPIEVAKASGKRRTYLVQAAIVFAAALLGAAAALSVDFFKNRQPAAAAAVVAPVVPASPDAASQTLEPARPVSRQSNDAAPPIQTTQPATPVESGARATQPIKIKEKTPGDSVKRKQKTAPPVEAAYDADIEFERYERRIRRRQAAQARRSGYGNRNIDRPRDAARIREIFEGPGTF